ncbi:hypothetical protein [Geodermatophilus sp. DSM 45219]|uniref:hypothetical protein n=1 Tax=Geodermatophilus sp. DSM 45219 TaxID=1881103 RepID=UPI0008807E90|nr:hypothetical protein [Geodermatophilus sp. DSM 45219]SDN38619.1 hypothetical protein SAMN05428965_0153 [Geodermatophilus sp. DSM 45219]
MRNPLHRLYQAKLVLLAVVFTVVGLALMVLAAWSAGEPGWQWLGRLPAMELGSTLFTTGLVVVAFTYVDGQDREARDTERLERVITAKAPAIRDAVIDGFAFKREDLARVATPERLDEIVTNSLALRLGDAAFAQDIYTDIREQAIRATERWYDARISIWLSPEADPPAGRSPLFVTTVAWEYTVVPTTQVRRFACVDDRADYRELAQDPTTSVWYVNPVHGIKPGSREAFELVQFAVEGTELPIRRSERSDGQTYSVNIGQEVVAEAKPVTIAYTYRTVVPVRGHLLHLDLEQPTKGVDIELDYSDCGIDYVNVVDFIASSERTRVSQSPKTVPGQRVSVGFDGWVFPRSGVAFVWVLSK